MKISLECAGCAYPYDIILFHGCPQHWDKLYHLHIPYVMHISSLHLIYCTFLLDQCYFDIFINDKSCVCSSDMWITVNSTSVCFTDYFTYNMWYQKNIRVYVHGFRYSGNLIVNRFIILDIINTVFCRINAHACINAPPTFDFTWPYLKNY